MATVTAAPPEWRAATAPATSSTNFITSPPWIVPSRFVWVPVMIRDSVVREAEVGFGGGTSAAGVVAMGP